MPSFFAALGTRLWSVIPGIVLISRSIISLFLIKKSKRPQLEQPIILYAFLMILFMVVLVFCSISGKVNLVKSDLYLAS